MKFDKLKFICLTLLLLILTGCGSKQPELYNDYSKYFEEGEIAFKKKKYEKAIEKFSMVILNSPGGDLADDSQFYLGECYFQKKEYLLAISEYEQLIQRYSYSPLVEESYYKIAISYINHAPKYQLDQESTHKAFQRLQEFVDTFPHSKFLPDAEIKIEEVRNKLARKLYESGRLYRKLNEYNSAIIYFDKMLKKYYDTDWAYLAKVEKARCLIQLRKFEEYQKLYAKVNREKDEIINSQDSKLKSLINPGEKIELLDKLYKKELAEIEKEKKKTEKRW